jgi:hypothetical protein
VRKVYDLPVDDLIILGLRPGAQPQFN